MAGIGRRCMFPGHRTPHHKLRNAHDPGPYLRTAHHNESSHLCTRSSYRSCTLQTIRIQDRRYAGIAHSRIAQGLGTRRNIHHSALCCGERRHRASHNGSFFPDKDPMTERSSWFLWLTLSRSWLTHWYCFFAKTRSCSSRSPLHFLLLWCPSTGSKTSHSLHPCARNTRTCTQQGP